MDGRVGTSVQVTELSTTTGRILADCPLLFLVSTEARFSVKTAKYTYVNTMQHGLHSQNN